MTVSWFVGGRTERHFGEVGLPQAQDIQKLTDRPLNRTFLKPALGIQAQTFSARPAQVPTTFRRFDSCLRSEHILRGVYLAPAWAPDDSAQKVILSPGLAGTKNLRNRSKTPARLITQDRAVAR
jgi:hypothetical protein